jgi:hypothetical protein
MKVKYLLKSFKKAREKNLSNEFLFHLQLKSVLDGKGFIDARKIHNFIHTKIGYSKGQSSNLVKKLIELGWIEVWKNKDNTVWRYNIVSLKRVYNKLGFRFNKNSHKHRFETINIIGKSKNQIKSIIQSAEIKKNIKSQLFKQGLTLDNKILYNQSRIGKDKKEETKIKRNETLLHLNEKRKEIEKSLTTLDVSLSLSMKKVSSLMGFKAQSQVVKLNKEAEKSKLYNVIRQKISLGISSFADFVSKLSTEFKNCYWKRGRVYKKVCNSYSINLQ